MPFRRLWADGWVKRQAGVYGQSFAGHPIAHRIRGEMENDVWLWTLRINLSAVEEISAILLAAGSDNETPEIEGVEGLSRRADGIHEEIINAIKGSAIPLCTAEDVAKATKSKYPCDSRFRGEMSNLKKFGFIDKVGDRYIAIKGLS